MIDHLICSGLTLSHIVDMYYNPQWGVVASQGVGTSKKLNSCVRYDNYYSDVDQVKLRQEALVFGTELRSILVIPVSDDALSAAIALTIERLNNEIRCGCSTVFETGILKIMRSCRLLIAVCWIRASTVLARVQSKENAQMMQRTPCTRATQSMSDSPHRGLPTWGLSGTPQFTHSGTPTISNR